jgi:predicted DNA-binding transcriptional regulator AlpA
VATKSKRKKSPKPQPKREPELRTEGAPVDQQGERPIRLLTKKEVCERVRLTFPTIWKRMRDGTFPRTREMNFDEQGQIKAVWLEHEIEAWMLGLPVRQYLGKMKKVGRNVRIVGSPHHSTIEKGTRKGT